MKPDSNSSPADLEELFDKAIEDRLEDGERARLEELVIEDASVRGRYVTYLHLHASLASDSAALPRILGEDPALPAPVRRIAFAPLAIAAALALATFIFLYRQTILEPVATLVEAEDCRWAGSELPTVQGASLLPGTLNLVEGIATLRFESGAVVSLEAPVSIEVVSPMLCRLVAGSVVAEVPESAHGFVIETPDMQVIDHGTRFGVTSNEFGQSQVFVFEGLVEVGSDLTPTAPRMLKTGQSIRLEPKDTAAEQEPSRGLAPTQGVDSDGWTVIPTSLGNGKDTFVRHDGGNSPMGREPLAMVKHTDLAEGNQRKAYFGFDLSSVPDFSRIEEAQFSLEIERSGLGFLAMVPHSRFVVYGLVDGEEDNWNEYSLTWEDAPANTLEGDTLDPGKVLELGSFEIRRGAGTGARTISGKALVDFLKADTNGIATLIIVRKTGETDKMGLVHAFASREHPTARPPALRLRTR